MSTAKDRRWMNWPAIRQSPRQWLALLGGTYFGVGLLPWAPGTWGTLAALPLWYWSESCNTTFRIALWLGLAGWGVWSAYSLDRVNGTRDNQNIVMDEVTGVGITAWWAGQHVQNYVAAFLVFRVLDMTKPFPARSFDRWSHEHGSAWKSAIGVMADDWVVGLQGLLLLKLAQSWGWLP
ncbi:MAG: hypothetical protein RJB38_1182 [Pseudomonadota bacterium]|jgi:phosphatidylglycerophosphatase A